MQWVARCYYGFCSRNDGCHVSGRPISEWDNNAHYTQDISARRLPKNRDRTVAVAPSVGVHYPQITGAHVGYGGDGFGFQCI